ncbi:MAG: hypothetical protein HYZ42_16320 [Bacteroidetes bacterium]|nr:hypothetical protein [Bacteroidota bacterium]
MENSFTKAMTQRSDEELLKITTEQRNDWQEEAVLAAEHELTKRNLSLGEIEMAMRKNAHQNKQIEDKANEPLETVWRILTFLFPAIFTFILSTGLRTGGYERKADELNRWTYYGIGFYILIIILSKNL